MLPRQTQLGPWRPHSGDQEAGLLWSTFSFFFFCVGGFCWRRLANIFLSRLSWHAGLIVLMSTNKRVFGWWRISVTSYSLIRGQWQRGGIVGWCVKSCYMIMFQVMLSCSRSTDEDIINNVIGPVITFQEVPFYHVRQFMFRNHSPLSSSWSILFQVMLWYSRLCHHVPGNVVKFQGDSNRCRSHRLFIIGCPSQSFKAGAGVNKNCSKLLSKDCCVRFPAGIAI